MENVEPSADESSAGEKRRAEEEEENGDGIGARSGKRMRRVAEIVMVLSAMSRVRGGRVPTEAEAALMAEARAKLVEICEGLAPKDLVARDAIKTVVEDLGLNSKVNDRGLGFRGSKLSIKEKFLLAKMKMEDSKKFSAPVGYTSQTSQPNVGVVSESRGPSYNIRAFSSDKPSNASLPAGGFPASSPLSYVSAATSLPVTNQPLTIEARASMVSSGFGTPVSLPRVEKAQFKLEGGPNGTSYAPQVQANASVNNSMVNAPIRSVQQLHSASSVKSPPENKVLNHNVPKVEGTSDLGMPRVAVQAARDQTFKPFITQTAPANFPGVHQPMQGVKYVQPSPLFSNHSEIAKIVQKLLQPKLPEHPTWNPPSREYMSKPLTCQMCKLTVNEVENVVLCDACEKGYHLKCLESINQKAIPMGEWHCTRCMSLSNGKPLPPKYGRVMRSITPPKAPCNPAVGQSTSEKKVGNFGPKHSQGKITMNEGSGLQNCAESGNVDSNHVESASNSQIPCSGDLPESNIASGGKDVNLGTAAGAIPNNLTKSSDAVCDSLSVGSLIERSIQPIQISESTTNEKGVMSESKLLPPVIPSDHTHNRSEHFQPSNSSQDIGQTKLSFAAEVPSSSRLGRPMIEESQSIRGAIDCTSGIDDKKIKQDVTQANAAGCSELNDEARNDSGSSSGGLHNVEWSSNILQVVDGKQFYESCVIDGITYRVQNYALFRSIHDRLVPYKLQAMWEDIKNGLKWLNINQCFFPGDLPESVGRPCAPETNEVYESNHETSVMAGMIQGPCEVLPPTKFKENSDRRSLLGNEGNNKSLPFFLCKWFYDERRGSFQPVYC